MMYKTLIVMLACFSSAALPDAIGQVTAENSPPLEVITRNGADKDLRLASYDGVVPMVMVRPNQTIPVTLQFPSDKAGTPVGVTPLDGGRIDGGTPGILPTGKFVFTFSPGAMPGRYRVLVHVPGAEYLLEFYVVDPNNPPSQKRPRGIL